MQKILTFNDFIAEELVHLSDELDEFTVQNEGDGKFSMESEGAPVNFTVLPVPSDTKFYEELFKELSQAVEDEVPVELYQCLEKMQKLPYKFGNVVSASLSLENVPALPMSLTDEQKAMLKTPVEFLKTQFGSISKELKSAVVLYLKKRAQLYAVVLECLFFYLRSQKTEQEDEN